MISIKKAPAGYFSSLISDTINKHYPDGKPEYSWYEVTGGWAHTEADAVAALKKEIPKYVKKLDKYIADIQEKLDLVVAHRDRVLAADLTKIIDEDTLHTTSKGCPPRLRRV